MSRACPITQAEIEELLQVGADGKPNGELKFHRMDLKGVYEITYGMRIREDMTLRIFSSISTQGGVSRAKGKDVIQLCLFWKADPKAEPKQVGAPVRCLRVMGWRKNLMDKIKAWPEMIGPACKCGAPTVQRDGTHGKFYGCVLYPKCPAKDKR